MSSQQPSEPQTPPAQTPPARTPPTQAPPAQAAPKKKSSAQDKDPLRGSRTSGIWIAVLVLSLMLLLLAVFILQNTQKVEVSYFGWNGQAPLAATVLIAAGVGALVVASAGALRILQLRRRVKHQRR